MSDSGPREKTHIRLFAGLRCDAAAQAGLSAWQDALPDMRWMRPETFHITLVFLGRVPVGLLPDVRAALDGVRGRAMTLRTSDPGIFRHGRRAVLCAGIVPSAELETLREAVGRALAPVVPVRGKGGFCPHITVGRSRRGWVADSEVTRVWMAHCRALEPVVMRMSRFGLVESVLRPDGAEHSLVQAWELEAPVA